MDVRTICLGLLSKEDRSGYEIKKLLEEGPLGHFVDASFGSIYPALTRLTEEGHVEFRIETQEARPDKKTYSITSSGLTDFHKTLHAPIAPDRHKSDFLFVLMFAEHLTPAAMSDLIDQRLAYYEEHIAEITAEVDCDTTPGPRFVAGHALAIFGAAKSYLENNRHILEGEALRSAAGSIATEPQDADLGTLGE